MDQNKTTKLNSKTQNHFTNEFLKYKLKPITDLITKHGMDYYIRNDGFGRATILLFIKNDYGTQIDINIKKNKIDFGQYLTNFYYELDDFGMIKGEIDTADWGEYLWGDGHSMFMSQINLDIIDLILTIVKKEYEKNEYWDDDLKETIKFGGNDEILS